MPTYAYKAVSGDGRKSRGFEHAASPGALSRVLEERGLLVLEVGDAPADAATGGGRFKFGLRREVLEVTRAMSALLPAGMPLAQSLNAATGVASGEVRTALQEVRARVERGETLSDSLAQYPRLFTPMYIGVVRAGERSGDLDSAFSRLATQLERDEQLRGRILSAAIYPLLLATAGTIAVTVLLFFVLPRFVGLLAGSGAKLPTSTRILLGVSSVLHQFWYMLILIPAGIALFITWLQQTAEGRLAGARAMLALPLISTLRRYALAARFSRLVGVLLGGGAPLLTALDDTVESTQRSTGARRGRANPHEREGREFAQGGDRGKQRVPHAPVAARRRRRGSGPPARVPAQGRGHFRGANGTRHPAAGDVDGTGDDHHVRRGGRDDRAVAPAGDLRHQRIELQVMRLRRGFTLLEMSIILAIMAISAALVIPAYSDLGTATQALPGDALLKLLRDARRLAIEQSLTVAVRVDPATNYYRVDTTGAYGAGMLVDGTLEIGAYETLKSDLPRLQYVFRPSGAALGDTVTVQGNSVTAVLAVDPWSGEAGLYAR